MAKGWKSLGLVLAVGVFSLSAAPSMAVVDPVYACLTNTATKITTSSGNEINLPVGTRMQVKFFHECLEYCKAVIFLQNNTKIYARYSVYVKGSSEVPPDRVKQNGDGIIWFHAKNGDPEQMTKIRLTCEKGSGLY